MPSRIAGNKPAHWRPSQRISVAVKDARDHARNKNATTCTNRRVKFLFLVHDRKKATKPANNKVAMAGPASRKNICLFYTPAFRAGASGQAHGRIEKHVDLSGVNYFFSLTT